MRYDVRAVIGYSYESAASASRHLVRLKPIDLPGVQRLVASHLKVKPQPDEWTSRTDFFGNQVAEVAFLEPHSEISFELRSRVEVSVRAQSLDITPRLGPLAAEIQAVHQLDAASPHHFTGSSIRSPLHPETTAYAKRIVADSPSVLSAVEAVGRTLHEEMTFDADATTVDTPMREAFAARHGVCQDFSHIMISALRGVGIPAGYVSGFLRTNPPEGQPRLEGADAMHAWVMAWCGSEGGWIEYDPTNAVFAGTDHILVARGRDFADVSPVRGTMRTSGDHTSVQQVDVIPVS